MLGRPVLYSCRQPKDAFHCKLLFFGKLSKALIWRKEETFIEPRWLTPPPPPGSSLWLFTKSLRTQTMLWKSFTTCQLKKKKKKKASDCSGPSICNCPKRIIHFGGGYGWSSEYIPTLFSALQNNKNVKTQTKEVPRWQERDSLDPRGIYSPGSSKALSPQNASSRPFY